MTRVIGDVSETAPEARAGAAYRGVPDGIGHGRAGGQPESSKSKLHGSFVVLLRVQKLPKVCVALLFFARLSLG